MLTFQFKTEPFAHQLEVFEMSRDRGIYALFMEQGTGKSKVVVDTAAWLYAKGEIETVVVVAPKGVYLNWVRKEFPIHLHESVPVSIKAWSSYTTTAQLKSMEQHLIRGPRLRVLAVNVEALSQDKAVAYVERFLKTGPSLMVVDESTTIKSKDSTRTKEVIKLGRMAKYRRILTGTPVTQGPLDLFSQCLFLERGLIGHTSFVSFKNEVAVTQKVTYGPRAFEKIVGWQNLDKLQERLKPFSYRKTKLECLDLPPKLYETIDVEMSAEQRRVYDQLRREYMLSLEGKQLTVQTVLALAMKLHQLVCGHLTTDDGTVYDFSQARMNALLDLLENVQGKAIIWANYRADLKNITKVLRETYGDDSVAEYFGGTEDEAGNVDKFQDGPARWFVGNPQKGGYGITLTSANTVIYYSNSFNLEHRLQSEDRPHRIGQKNPVTYYDFICRGTPDEKVVNALLSKRDVAISVLGDEWREWFQV